MKKLYQCGYTLIEMMVVVAVLAIISTIALPNFQNLLQGSRVSAQASEFLTALHFARSEAVKRNALVTICKSSNAVGCVTTGAWEQGWIVFVDSGVAGTVDVGDVVLRVHASLKGGVTLVGGVGVADFFSYTASGQSPQSGQFDLCPMDTSLNGRDITLSVGTGRPVIAVDPAPCS